MGVSLPETNGQYKSKLSDNALLIPPSAEGFVGRAKDLTDEEANALHERHQAILCACTLQPGHREALRRRGLTDAAIAASGYGSRPDGLVIPCRDLGGRITSLLIRKDS